VATDDYNFVPPRGFTADQDFNSAYETRANGRKRNRFSKPVMIALTRSRSLGVGTVSSEAKGVGSKLRNLLYHQFHPGIQSTLTSLTLSCCGTASLVSILPICTYLTTLNYTGVIPDFTPFDSDRALRASQTRTDQSPPTVFCNGNAKKIALN
jgi:hypothetical protein